MARLEVDKERFKSFLDQFVGDAPYQIELVKALISQMPEQVAEGLIEELYYQKVYDGNLYIAQHAVYKDDIHRFPNFESLLRFLNGVNKNIGEYNPDSLLNLDKKTIMRRMQQNLPLCGYIITMEEKYVESTKQITRAELFR